MFLSPVGEDIATHSPAIPEESFAGFSVDERGRHEIKVIPVPRDELGVDQSAAFEWVAQMVRGFVGHFCKVLAEDV